MQRSRRTTLAVPGSSARFIEKAQGLPADEIFLDLEDAVAEDAKADARKTIVAALNEALAAAMEDGTWRDLYEEWFPGSPMPEQYLPSSEQTE